jgi:hypothetical protein
MIGLPWTQLSGVVAGGLVGGFSGFVANSFQERQQFGRTRQNVACALVGEIDALRQHIEESYLAKLRADLESNISETQAKPGINLEDADDALTSWHRLDGAPAGRSRSVSVPHRDRDAAFP